MYKTVLFGFGLLLCTVDAYKILSLMPFAGLSHFKVFHPLLKTLSENGHEVTVISHFPGDNKHPNYTDINLSDDHEKFINSIPFGMFKQTMLARFLHMMKVGPFAVHTCEQFFNSKQLLKFLVPAPKFDLVLVESFPSSCSLGILQRVQAPYIVLESTIFFPFTSDYFGQPDNPSYIPTILADVPRNMGFVGRLENFVVYIISKILYGLYVDNPANNIARKYLGDDLPRLNLFSYNASLMLFNTYHALHGPIPFVPSIIEVGGIHIETPKNLPSVSPV